MKKLQLSTEPISTQQDEVARCHKDFKFGNEIFNIHLMFSKDGAKTFAKSKDGYIEINNEELMLSQKFDSCNEEHLQYHLFYEMDKLLFSANGEKTYVVSDNGILEDAADLIADHLVTEPEYPTISNPFEYALELFKDLVITTEQDELLVSYCIRLLNTEEECIIAETYPDLFVNYLHGMMSLGGKDDFDLTLSFLESYNKINSNEIQDYLNYFLTERLEPSYSNDEIDNLTSYCEQEFVNDCQQNIIAIETKFPEYYEQYQLRKPERSRRKQQSNQERKTEDNFRVINDGIVVSINPLNETQTKIYNDSKISDYESKLLFDLDGTKIYRKCSDEWVQIPYILSNPISYEQQRIQIIFGNQDYILKFSSDGNNSYAFSKERKIVKIIEKAEAIKKELDVDECCDFGDGYIITEIDETDELYETLIVVLKSIDSY